VFHLFLFGDSSNLCARLAYLFILLRHKRDRGLRVFEPLVGGGTYREGFVNLFVVDGLCGDTCQRVTVCGLMSLVATHSEKIKLLGC